MGKEQDKQGGEAVEVVAFLMKPDFCDPYVDLRRDSSGSAHVDPLMTVAQHKRIVAAQDAEIARLCDDRDALRKTVDSYDRHSSGIPALAEIERLRAQLAAQQAAVPVAVVDCSDDACWADILDDVTVKVGQKLYAAPAAPQQGVVMPESIKRAFITGESGNEQYRVVLKFESLSDMQSAHSYFARLNGDKRHD